MSQCLLGLESILTTRLLTAYCIIAREMKCTILIRINAPGAMHFSKRGLLLQIKNQLSSPVAMGDIIKTGSAQTTQNNAVHIFLRTFI